MSQPQTAATAAHAEPKDDLGRVGIIGAGKLGLALAAALVAAGYDVAVSGSGDVDAIGLQVDVLAPGARPMTTADVAAFAATTVLALPMHRFRDLSPDLFDAHVLIDAMNYWPDTGGIDPTLADAPEGTTPSCSSTSQPRESSRASTNSATTR